MEVKTLYTEDEKRRRGRKKLAVDKRAKVGKEAGKEVTGRRGKDGDERRRWF